MNTMSITFIICREEDINDDSIVEEILTMLRASLSGWPVHFISRLHLRQKRIE